MYPNGYPSASYPGTMSDGIGSGAYPMERHLPRRRYWIHLLLFALTLLTTTAVGARIAQNFEHNRPAFELEGDLAALGPILSDPALLLSGLPFSLTLIAILLAHELGHYFACSFYGVNASLPYFLPAPTIIGTFGAFIRIRSPIYSKRVLFDIGVAGPVAGFVFLLPALGVGLAYSKIVPGIALQGDLIFGSPAILSILQALVFPGIPDSDIYLHPIGRAAWVGLIATALNLLPIGQSDGGHILYTFFGKYHRLISRIAVAALIPIGFFYWYGWLLWAGFFLVFGMKHPPTIYDGNQIGGARRQMAWLALLILVLSFAVAPIRPGGTL